MKRGQWSSIKACHRRTRNRPQPPFSSLLSAGRRKSKSAKNEMTDRERRLTKNERSSLVPEIRSGERKDFHKSFLGVEGLWKMLLYLEKLLYSHIAFRFSTYTLCLLILLLAIHLQYNAHKFCCLIFDMFSFISVTTI